MKSISTFLKVKLRLKANLQKSAVDITNKRKFLGFNLYHYHEGIRIRIAPQAIKRFKIKIREITSRSNGQNIIKRILRLNLFAGDSLNSALPNAYWVNLGLMSLTNRYCEIRSAL